MRASKCAIHQKDEQKGVGNWKVGCSKALAEMVSLEAVHKFAHLISNNGCLGR